MYESAFVPFSGRLAWSFITSGPLPLQPVMWVESEAWGKGLRTFICKLMLGVVEKSGREETTALPGKWPVLGGGRCDPAKARPQQAPPGPQ